MLKEAKLEVHDADKRCANHYLNNSCRQIQIDVEFGNVHEKYQRMNRTFGPIIVNSAPLKMKEDEVLSGTQKQMER